MDFHALSGMRDYIGSAREDLSHLVSEANDVFGSAGYRQIETPVLEDARLFDRSLGEETDIVSKEMYTIEQSGDRIIAMRPENTAGVARAVIENDLMAQRNQLKLNYAGSMFRHERPQSGRQREFHQVGVELFGRSDPFADAEVIQLGQEYLRRVDVESPVLLLNSIGCPKCRPGYLEDLTEILEEHREELCENCQRRIDTNPLRVLDCKNETCQSIYQTHVPSILEALCEDCDEHFDRVKGHLDRMGIEFELDPFLVRGLDYYRRTAFEFVAGDLGSQDAVLAGGRYDGLVEELGGDHTPAVGFAAGLERLMILRGTHETDDVDARADCYVVSFDDETLSELLPVVTELRRQSFPGSDRPVRVEVGNPDDSVKSQFRRADRYNARAVFLMGEDERSEGVLNVKRMDTGEQKSFEFEGNDMLVQSLLTLLDDIDPSEI
ncbi:MAG: histidine--tRNA ligase [bacterium]